MKGNYINKQFINLYKKLSQQDKEEIKQTFILKNILKTIDKQ